MLETSSNDFQNFVSSNKTELVANTRITIDLLQELKPVLSQTQYNKILILSSLKDRATTFYDFLGLEPDKLEKVVKILRKNQEGEAVVSILEKFSSSSSKFVLLNPLGARPKVSALQLSPSTTGKDSSPNDNKNWKSDVESLLQKYVLQRYKSGGKYKGLVLIINIITFDNNPDAFRQGANIDTDQLSSLFADEFNFQVYVVHPECTTDTDLDEAIQDFKKLFITTDADSCVVALMSHGDDKNNIFTKNRVRFNLWTRVLEQFNNVNCPQLKGKPKIFLFQYCRGDVTDVGAVQHDSLPDRNTSTGAIIPTWTDMLVCYSTLEGYYAYRDAHSGSWFIQCLCQVFKQFATEYDVVKMLNIVSEMMKGIQGNQGEKQICPWYNIGFTKEFYLK